MPPANQERRDLLTDAAIEVLAREGAHGLTHRAVDKEAGVPQGTASNYFRNRDQLLEAATQRVVDLHWGALATLAARYTPPVDREQMIEILGEMLRQAVNENRSRYIAMYELGLEGVRRPTLQAVLAPLNEASVQATIQVHFASGYTASRETVERLMMYFLGVQFSLLTTPFSLQHQADPVALARALYDVALPREQPGQPE